MLLQQTPDLPGPKEGPNGKGGCIALPSPTSTRASHPQHLDIQASKDPGFCTVALKILCSRTKTITGKAEAPAPFKPHLLLSPQTNNRKTGENVPWEAQKEGSLSEAPRHLSPSRSLGLVQRHAPTHFMHRPSLPVRENLFSLCRTRPEYTQTHHTGVALPSPHKSDLADAAAARASKNHSAALVVIGSHGSQAIFLVHKKWCALDSDRAPQWLVEVLPTEVVINLQGL